MNITCKCGVKLLKGVLLCFFSFFKFDSVCHVYDKVNQSYKSLSPLQKEIIYFKKKFPFQELQRMACLDYKVVFLYLWCHKDNPAYWNSIGWGVEKTLHHKSRYNVTIKVQ